MVTKGFYTCHRENIGSFQLPVCMPEKGDKQKKMEKKKLCLETTVVSSGNL